jgi:NTP pyrophosphatase (non-canonical NTP hydrolase)
MEKRESYYDFMGRKLREDENKMTQLNLFVEDINISNLDRQTELMAITAEECGELVQSCMKIARWGVDKKKIASLLEEAGDVALMLDLLVENGYITNEELNARKTVKRLKLTKYSNLIN